MSLDNALWFIVRSSGWVALVLGVLALFLGFIFSARDTLGPKPAWWLDLHNYLGGLAIAFTGIHMVAVVGDSMNGLGLLETLVPFAAESAATGMALGTISFWLFAAAVFTSWPKRWLPRNIWRWIHLGSVAGVAMAGVHAWMVGSSSGTQPAQLALLTGAALFSYPFAVRIMKLTQKKPATNRIPANLRTQHAPR